jgi:hypothetical protein
LKIVICARAGNRAGFFVARAHVPEKWMPVFRQEHAPTQRDQEPIMSAASSAAGKPVTRALIVALAATPDADRSNLRRMVDALISKAVDGDLAAIREIFDRIDGKAGSAHSAGGEEPCKVEFGWKSEL